MRAPGHRRLPASCLIIAFDLGSRYAFDRVMRDGITLAQVLEQRRQCRELGADVGPASWRRISVLRQAITWDRATSRNSSGRTIPEPH